MQNNIQQTWFFQQQPSEVWEYLTQPELIEQWLTKTDFKPVVGHQFHFTNSCGDGSGKVYHTYCQVLKVIPNQLLSYSWRKGHDEKETTLDSVVTFTLTQKNGGTELLLQHNGFTLLQDFTAHNEGWKACLNKITEMINTTTNANA